MLSRAADALYWMCRYAERAENVARFLDVSLQVALDLPGSRTATRGPASSPPGRPQGLRGALRGPDARLRRPLLDGRRRLAQLDRVVPALRARQRAIDPRAHLVRDLGADQQVVPGRPRGGGRRDRSSRTRTIFSRRVKEASHLFVGVTYLTMTHGEGWHFGRLGRLLERADQTSRIVDAKQALILGEAARGGGEPRRDPPLGAAPIGERPRDVPKEVRPPRALVGHQLPRARQALPALNPPLPGQGAAVAPRHHRDPVRTRRARSPSACSAGSPRSTSTPPSRRSCDQGLHEHLDGLQLKLNRRRRGDPRDLLRHPSGSGGRSPCRGGAVALTSRIAADSARGPRAQSRAGPATHSRTDVDSWRVASPGARVPGTLVQG